MNDTKHKLKRGKMESLWQEVNQNIPQILNSYKNVAVVGLSPKSYKASYAVAAYLLHSGYTIFPVNPNYEEILGLPCYARLADIPQPVDIVDIFRRSEDVPPIVDDAIEKKAKVIWMQQGIVNEAAAKRALSAGVRVVMDLCMKIEHMQLWHS